MQLQEVTQMQTQVVPIKPLSVNTPLACARLEEVVPFGHSSLYKT